MLNARGEKVGVVTVHLYRPFSIKHLLAAIPASVKKIAVLDRTKEPGAFGEPLFLDVAAAVAHAGRAIRVVGGRYGLSSKDVLPEDILAAYRNLTKDEPKHGFTLGISPANSGASARTARSARTRARSKSSATTRTCSHKRISRTIPKNPAA